MSIDNRRNAYYINDLNEYKTEIANMIIFVNSKVT